MRHEVDATLELSAIARARRDRPSSLPEGQRKLLDVAMALVLQPKLMIMDEPTSGVSSDEKHALMETLMRALDERKVTSDLRRARHRHRAPPRDAAGGVDQWPHRRRRTARAGAGDPEVIRNVIGG